MLTYTILFLLIALAAAWAGFSLAAGTAALLAKICFVIFLVLFVLSLFKGRKKSTV